MVGRKRLQIYGQKYSRNIPTDYSSSQGHNLRCHAWGHIGHLVAARWGTGRWLLPL